MNSESGLISKECFNKERIEEAAETQVKAKKVPFFLLEAIEICEPAEVPVKWSKLREKGV